MTALSSFQSSLFYGAAFAHLIIIPKHIYVGATAIATTIKSIPDKPDTAVGKAVIGTLWDHGSCFLIISGTFSEREKLCDPLELLVFSAPSPLCTC
jgi:hypothetical protein